MSKTAPIVIAERITDLVALLLLALVGVFSYDVDPRFLIAGAVLVVAGLIVRVCRPGREGGDPRSRAGCRCCGRFAHRFDDFHAHTAILIAPLPLVVATTAGDGVVVLRVPRVLGGRARLPGRGHRPCRGRRSSMRR